MGLFETYPYHILAAFSLFGIVLFRQLNSTNRNPSRLPLPPGPKGYPLIGNLFDMPFDKPWLVYHEWCKTYGDMVYFDVLGHRFLILGSMDRINGLFEKRSSNYSDRPRLPMLFELMKMDFNFGLQPYGAEWRKARKSFHHHFNINVVNKYQPIQTREIHAFLRRLLDTPKDFLDHIRLNFASTVMDIAYGIKVQELGDQYVRIAEEAVLSGSEAAVPGAFWVDFLPILAYVPSWLPGAGFKRKAAHWAKINTDVIEKPFRHVQNQVKTGEAVPSVAAALIEQLPEEKDSQRLAEEKIGQGVAAMAYLAGADTTTSAVKFVFMAMALHPEVQKRAQAELDAVVGPHRLPDFEDRPSLPYISAIVKETLRWQLVLPLCVPHMATEDDEYDGYYIPKGTIVFGSAWSILHDPKIYKNPMEYQPERYMKDGKLNEDMMDHDTVPFGYGRRICPGRHLSDNSLFLIVSSVLSVYDIKPSVDENGNEIKITPEYTRGLLIHPIPFECIIKPRTAVAEALVRDSVNMEY